MPVNNQTPYGETVALTEKKRVKREKENSSTGLRKYGSWKEMLWDFQKTPRPPLGSPHA